MLGIVLFVSRRAFGRLVRRTAGTIGDAMSTGGERPHSADD
ncbi:hypothetical protein [Natrinema salsiterrestre]|nr:hypothetical protein [Natrinema salsiterrestre]